MHLCYSCLAVTQFAYEKWQYLRYAYAPRKFVLCPKGLPCLVQEKDVSCTYIMAPASVK